MQLLKAITMMILSLICLISCESNESFSMKEKSPKSLEVRFDIPQLLKLNITQVKERLGSPTSEFIPSAANLQVDPGMLSCLEYQNRSTSITINYSRSGKIETIFIADNTTGRKTEEILKLGNLKVAAKDYKIRVQNWINPQYAKEIGAAEIAGIEVTPFN